MQTLMAVIDDLWQFAYQGLSGSRVLTELDKEREVQATLPLVIPMDNRALLNQKSSNSYDGNFRPGEQYYVGELETYLYSDPVIAFDTATEKISYGQSVLVKKLGGRWAEVTVAGKPGWILKDVLRERREDIHPQFSFETVYTADNPETIKLRACIDDEFGAARASLALSAAEYVIYKLSLAKKIVTWPSDGPRVPGSWQKRLRGQLGIHISISPTTGSIMEYVIDDMGYLAYVEAVFPDSSIKLSQVGIPEDGQYTERTMTKEEYRELGPVFIEVV